MLTNDKKKKLKQQLQLDGLININLVFCIWLKEGWSLCQLTEVVSTIDKSPQQLFYVAFYATNNHSHSHLLLLALINQLCLWTNKLTH